MFGVIRMFTGYLKTHEFKTKCGVGHTNDNIENSCCQSLKDKGSKILMTSQ